ncbi:hypothetical protein QVD17_24800 [Tagetes erecta]|uniref:Myb-like domain-containing protein n=1 Tax=Tagetes erecta TaxID=13708 RepID=A0AAD8KFE5_TARER|nr:hypothetical protein QVD17_24800 [Tagetes erecta]
MATSCRIVEGEDCDESPEEVIPTPRCMSNRKKAKAWNNEEEDALAKAWIDVSEGPEIGNQQRSELFWKRALVHFEAQLGSTDRTVHQLNSKWKDMNAKIYKFDSVYKDKLANRQNDEAEVDILSATIVEYRKLYKTKAFPHHTTWNILKDNKNWKTAALMGAQYSHHAYIKSGKRTKMSGSNMYKNKISFEAQLPNDVNEENEGLHYEQPQIFPPKGKKPALSLASSGQQKLLKIVSEFNEFNQEDIEDKKRYRLEKLRLMKEEKEKKMLILEQELRMMQQKEMYRDMQFFLTPHCDLTGAALNVVLARKREITQRWGWE